jgi:hypothetical protein
MASLGILASKNITNALNKSLNRQGGLMNQRYKQSLRELNKTRTRIMQTQVPQEKTKLQQTQRQIQNQLQKQQQVLQQIQRNASRLPRTRLRNLRLRFPPIPEEIKVPPPDIRLELSKKRKMLGARSKPVLGYNVYGKSGGRYIKLNKAPLSKTDALSRGSYAIDNSTARTFGIKPVKARELGAITPKEQGYYNKMKKKFRDFKVKSGRAYKLKGRQIEKSKYLIDTRGEKRGLRLARLRRQFFRKPIRRRLKK